MFCGLSSPAFAEWKISEIGLYPPAGETQWIELLNDSSLPAPIDGLFIKGDRWEWRFSSLNIDVPEHTLILVRFDSPGDAATMEIKDGVRVLHVPQNVIFGDSQRGYCALYEKQAGSGPEVDQIEHALGRVLSAQKINSIDTMVKANAGALPDNFVDFVAWGDAPGQIGQEATDAGLWSGGQVFMWTDPAPERMPDGPAEPGQFFDKPGKTLGRIAGQWKTLEADEASPGRWNPEGLAPEKILKVLPGSSSDMPFSSFSLWWQNVFLSGGCDIQAQIATDAAFTHIVRELSRESHGKPLPPLDLGTYWWRFKTLDGFPSWLDVKNAPPEVPQQTCHGSTDWNAPVKFEIR
ncbi:MAG: hypothetical protein WCO69_01910 [Candidatus Omnitrophota bacterium]